MSKPDVISEALKRGRLNTLSSLSKAHHKTLWQDYYERRWPDHQESFTEMEEIDKTLQGEETPEEPDTVELTPREVEALLAAMFLIEDGEVAKRLGISHQEAVLALNSVYKKLKDD